MSIWMKSFKMVAFIPPCKMNTIGPHFFSFLFFLFTHLHLQQALKWTEEGEEDVMQLYDIKLAHIGLESVLHVIYFKHPKISGLELSILITKLKLSTHFKTFRGKFKIQLSKFSKKNIVPEQKENL